MLCQNVMLPSLYIQGKYTRTYMYVIVSLTGTVAYICNKHMAHACSNSNVGIHRSCHKYKLIERTRSLFKRICTAKIWASNTYLLMSDLMYTCSLFSVLLKTFLASKSWTNS